MPKKKKETAAAVTARSRRRRARLKKIRLAALPSLFVASDFTKLSALAEQIVSLRRMMEQTDFDPLLGAWLDGLEQQFHEIVTRCARSVMGGRGQQQ
jgi:hypothetical protein